MEPSFNLNDFFGMGGNSLTSPHKDGFPLSEMIGEFGAIQI